MRYPSPLIQSVDPRHVSCRRRARSLYAPVPERMALATATPLPERTLTARTVTESRRIRQGDLEVVRSGAWN